MKISQTVFELQSGHDFVTDRRTDRRTDRQTDDQGKNNMSPNPTGGDINIHEHHQKQISDRNTLIQQFIYLFQTKMTACQMVPISLL